MGTFYPPKITTAERTALILNAGEIVFDEDENIFYAGDGLTLGGLTLKGPKGDTGDGVVDGGVTTVKLVDDAVTTAKIAAGAVTGAELAVDSVDGSKLVAGAVDASKSVIASQVEAETGTDTTKLMTPERTAQAVNALGGGLVSVQTFTSSGTWVKPAGVKTVRVQLVGSGAGGRNSGRAGGAGGYSEKFIDVSGISSVSVTVGAAPGSYAAGNTSSFGSHCSATGGAIPSGTGNGGLGGIGIGGDINIQGGGGQVHGNTSPYNASLGGVSYFGGPAAGTQTSPTSPNNVTNGAYGSGGGATHNGYTHMPNPPSGIVIVWEYR